MKVFVLKIVCKLLIVCLSSNHVSYQLKYVFIEENLIPVQVLFIDWATIDILCVALFRMKNKTGQ